MSRRFFWLPFSFCTLLPSAASASEIFADTIKMVLAMPGPKPPCVTCHDTELGGSKMVSQPFGRRVVGYGLTAGDVQTLTGILGRMRESREDTDKDGMSDIDEIKAGRSPNVNDITGKPPDDYPPPVYGCRSSGARRDVTLPNGGWTIAMAGLLLARWLRRRVPRYRDVRSTLVHRLAPRDLIARTPRKDV
jgi:hypothetical protein